MLDIKFIRENEAMVRDALKNKKVNFDLDSFLKLDIDRREYLKKVESLKSELNKESDKIAQLKKEGKIIDSLLEKNKKLSEEIRNITENLNKIEYDFERKLLEMPNIPDADTPIGKSAADNKIVSQVGEIKKFDFKPKTHIEIAQDLDIIDFSRAAKISGSNFVLFKGMGARLERALLNFMLDLHTKKHGYTEVFPPFLVNRKSMTGTGQLPKLEEDMYHFKEDDLFLIPTAEVPVTNIYADEILDEDSLPIYYTAYTACFRREAGSYGKDTKGLMRVHQFDKVELVKFVKPDASTEELEKLLQNAEEVLKLLKLPYRVIMLCTADLSFAAAKCYDIELWAPGVEKYLEVSSCSNFRDFQARRANIRYKPSDGGKPKFINTLNGSGVALARLVVAILENYQQKDGSVLVPEVLKPYMDGLGSIK